MVMTSTDKIPALRPTLIMETSWEVCNKVGGIYTVLSTRSATMIEQYGTERVLFIGPWFDQNDQKDFCPSDDLQELQQTLSAEVGLSLHIGHWEVPGRPRCILVDYKPLYEETGALYFEMWEHYGLRGEMGYGDYDESCHFAIAAAMVMRAYTRHWDSERPVGIFNEWTTGMGLLWLRLHAPKVATVFITHATTVGRSIAGNGKQLYKYMEGYHGDQMAEELGVVGKHAIEKRAAWTADAFGTVSEVTNIECKQLLDKGSDQVVYNGFEQDFLPNSERYQNLRRDGRRKLIQITQTLYGCHIDDGAFVVATSGRSEYRNKGLDVFIESLRTLAERCSHRQIIAVIAVPSWVKGARTGIRFGIESGEELTMPMRTPYITHELHDPDHNPILGHLRNLSTLWGGSVYPLFVPSYLDGNDGVLDISYYDLLPALDLSVFASYYEPWGYTPLESIAFGVPTVTTDKAGFGLWARQHIQGTGISEGIVVLERSDENFDALVTNIANTIQHYSELTAEQRVEAIEGARKTAQRADWHHFFPQYERAFNVALTKRTSTLS